MPPGFSRGGRDTYLIAHPVKESRAQHLHVDFLRSQAEEALKLLILNSILLNLRVIPHFIRADRPWDLHGFLRTSRLGLFKNRAFCGTFNMFTFKASVCSIHGFLRTRNPQLLRTMFFYAQDTLNSDLMRNYRFQGSLLGSPLGWPEKGSKWLLF